MTFSFGFCNGVLIAELALLWVRLDEHWNGVFEMGQASILFD